jgi:glycosyltransferase involved in cell wall biosynthesis
MNILFLTYHGFDEASGISKKMLAQIKGFRQNGHEVHVCSYDYSEGGHLCRFVDGTIIQDYGRGLVAGILQRINYSCIVDYCVKNKIELVYSRNYQNASPWLVHMFRYLRNSGIRCVQEIPTYPYDKEFKGYPLDKQIELFIDKLYRRNLAKEMDAIVTFSGARTIFGQKTINISNGVDFDAIPLCSSQVQVSGDIHVIAVAEVHTWHGFDRFIHGLGEYYNSSPKRRVYFHIVGDVWKPEMFGSNRAPGFQTYINKYKIKDYVIFHGRLFGEALTEVFNLCCFAVGSLGRHRSGITQIKTLKNREYACRGIPFIYSEMDSDFDNQPYVLKAPADESPIEIGKVLEFIDKNSFSPESIRQTVEHLSWKIQMAKVMDGLTKMEML